MGRRLLRFGVLFYLAALQAIPTDVYEAAAIDGAGTWRTFWKVTFPLLKPGHFFVAVVSIIGALQLFVQSQLLTAGGPSGASRTAVLFLFETAFGRWELGYASAAAEVLFLIILVVTLTQYWATSRGEADGR